MMNESAFADAVLTNTEKALAEYGLSMEDVQKFKEISGADFDSFVSVSPEERKSMMEMLALNYSKIEFRYP